MASIITASRLGLSSIAPEPIQEDLAEDPGPVKPPKFGVEGPAGVVIELKEKEQKKTLPLAPTPQPQTPSPKSKGKGKTKRRSRSRRKSRGGPDEGKACIIFFLVANLLIICAIPVYRSEGRPEGGRFAHLRHHAG